MAVVRRAPLRTICGPTAAGKSAIALSLAERHGATIVSADSRQVYRGFDIGTAKPTADDRRRVPHLGVDLCAPTERFSASAWAGLASAWIAETESAGRTAVVVGGTGFYIRALVEPLFHEPAINATRRSALAAAMSEWSVPELRRWCAVLDPPRSALGRTQLLRSIEIALLAGARLSDLQRSAAGAARFAPRYLVVDPGRNVLKRRIEDRVHEMLARGWVSEVARLRESVPADAPAWNATGYATLARLLAGEMDLDAARQEIVIATRQYAKRQRTWLRHQLEDAAVTRVHPDDSGALAAAHAWWEGEDAV